MKNPIGLFKIIVFFPLFLQAQFATLNSTFEFRQVNGNAIAYQNGMPFPNFEYQKGNSLDLAGAWKKQRFSANHDYSLAARDVNGYANIISEASGRHLKNYNDDSWAAVPLPAVENTINTYPDVPEYYQDGVWYRKHFNVPDSLTVKNAILKFYSVNYVADVWLNDQYLGYHEGGYTPFAFDISGLLGSDSVNVLAVRVDNPPWGTRQDIVPYTEADWFNYTGIIHDVRIDFFGNQFISQIQCSWLAGNQQAQIRSLLINSETADIQAKLKTELFEADVNSANLDSRYAEDLINTNPAIARVEQLITIPADSVLSVSQLINIANIKHWSAANPHLYIVKTVLEITGQHIDSLFIQTGFREVTPSGKYILLNQNKVFYPGVARHEDHPLRGRSIPVNVIFDDLKQIKELNALFLRTAHYPNHPFTYIIADRLGLAVMEEIPVWWFDESLPWVLQNSLRKIHLQMWREMIHRDFNRPSILLWGTNNECLDVSNRKTFIEMAKNDMAANYPNNRLITQSAAADRPGAFDASQASCDIAGWTMYYGIFYGTDYYQDTKNFLNNIEGAYPDKPVLNTEFGYWSGEGGWNLGEQVTVLNQTFKAFYERAVLDSSGNSNPDGFLAFVDWWCAFDWYSHQHPNGFQSMGLIQMNRTSYKPVAERLRQIYKPFKTQAVISSLENRQGGIKPGKSYLHHNFPNPFNPFTDIRYSLNESGNVRLEVFDVRGQQIQVLVNKDQAPGDYTVRFGGKELASGYYFYRLLTNNIAETKKMCLVK